MGALNTKFSPKHIANGKSGLSVTSSGHQSISSNNTTINSKALQNAPFPKDGIRLSYLLTEFIRKNGGRPAFEGLTTLNVCDQFVKPVTKNDHCSYVTYLKRQQQQQLQQQQSGKDEESLSTNTHLSSATMNSFRSTHSVNSSSTKRGANQSAVVGKAEVFISHAWSYRFLDVIDALNNHFRDKPDIIIWFDNFSVNQHEVENFDFNWWSTVFKNAIKDFGHTVMIFAPWYNPVPLTRAWCLWELYCTADTKSKFEVAMTDSEQRKFFSAIIEDPEVPIDKMLSTIDVKHSQCYKEADRLMIFAAIQKISSDEGPGDQHHPDNSHAHHTKGNGHHHHHGTDGISRLNAVVFERMREWVIEATEQELATARFNAGVKLDLKMALGGLYLKQGRLDRAEPLFVECYEHYSRAYHELSYTLNSHRQARDTGNSSVVLPPTSNSSSGQQHLRVTPLVAPNNGGNMNNSNHHHNQQLNVFGGSPVNPLQVEHAFAKKLQAANNLGHLYMKKGSFDQAYQYLNEAYSKRKETFNDKNKYTLSSIFQLAKLYERDDESKVIIDFEGNRLDQQMRQLKAFEKFQECYNGRLEILGDTHVDTLAAYNALLRYQIMAIVITGSTIGSSSSKNGSKVGTIVDEKSLQVCYDRCVQQLKENHPVSWMALCNIAYYLESVATNFIGNIPNALSLSTTVMTSTSSHSPQPLSSNVLLQKAKDHIEIVEDKHQQCLQISQQILGNHHPDVVAYLKHIYSFYKIMSDKLLNVIDELEKKLKLVPIHGEGSVDEEGGECENVDGFDADGDGYMEDPELVPWIDLHKLVEHRIISYREMYEQQL